MSKQEKISDVFGEDEPQTNAEPDTNAAFIEQTEEEKAFVPEVDVELAVDGKDKGPEGKRDATDEAWFEIEIDEVEGRPNFEVVGVNGTVYRIKRGEPVSVPASVLEVLNHAVAERVVQTDVPGGVETTRRKYSAVPFRMLRAL
jgi:hypothetical protein